MNSTIGNILIRTDTTYNFKLHWVIDNFLPLLKTTSVLKSPSFRWKDISWQLNMMCNSEKEIQLDLHKITCEKEVDVELEFGLRLKDRRMELRFFAIKNFNDVAYSFGTEDLIQESELLERNHQIMPEGILTVYCLMACRHTSNQQSREENYDDLDGLSSDFKTLFGCFITSDITIIVGEQSYPAHKTFLIARSDVFEKMFEHDTEETNTDTIKISDCEPTAFREFLQYLYTGKVGLSCYNVYDLYKAADKYNVQSLKELCIKYIKENESARNFTDIVLANQLDD